jgi:diguanylate cyclase (GGDEF)-like protein
LGTIIRDAFRENDMAFRYGGEEFAVLMTHLGPGKGQLVCERLIDKVAEHVFKYETFNIYITISVGVSEYMIDADQEPGETIKRSIAALQRAKKAGGNRVVIE